MAKPSEHRKSGDEERIFVKDGLRSFRKTFRVGEVYWGAATGLVLVGLIGWVTWKGAHPDPNLFDMSAALEGGSPGAGGAGLVEPATRRAGSRLGAPRTGVEGAAEGPATEGAVSETAGSQAGSERGPLPVGLAQGAYEEGKIGAYSSDTMYVKIDGRAGYFQAFGVKSLHTVTLEAKSETAPTSVDIEVYDLGESRNAIGAYNGERSPGAESTSDGGSTFHFDRNAAFLARGRYYVRFIGSDESPPVVAEVRRLLDVFRRELAEEALPWGFSLFIGQLKLSPSAVTYVKSNAFSFGFARDVFKASLSPPDSQEDMEAFVVALADPAAAKATAAAFVEGFASLGKPGGQTPDGVRLIEDEFLGTFSAVTAVERWTIGVRGAPSQTRAARELDRLRQAIVAMPEELRARAMPSAEPSAPEPAAEAEMSPGVTAPPGTSASTRANTSADQMLGETPGQPAEESSDEY